jgi:hypothetical protein
VHKDFKASVGGYLRHYRIVATASDLEAVLAWVTPAIAETLSDALKDRLRTHLFSTAWGNEGGLLQKDRQAALSKLPIFKELVPCEYSSDQPYKTAYSSLHLKQIYPVSNVPCIPIISGAHFFDVSTNCDNFSPN